MWRGEEGRRRAGRASIRESNERVTGGWTGGDEPCWVIGGSLPAAHKYPRAAPALLPAARLSCTRPTVAPPPVRPPPPGAPTWFPHRVILVAGFIAGSQGSGSSLAVEMEGHVQVYLRVGGE